MSQNDRSSTAPPPPTTTGHSGVPPVVVHPRSSDDYDDDDDDDYDTQGQPTNTHTEDDDDDDFHTEDEDYTDADDGGGESADVSTDSESGYSSEEEGEYATTFTEEEEDEDDNVSYHMDARNPKVRTLSPRTPAQQEQQRRLVDRALAQASSTNTSTSGVSARSATGLVVISPSRKHHNQHPDENETKEEEDVGMTSSYTIMSGSGEYYPTSTSASYSDTLGSPREGETQTFDDDDDEGMSTTDYSSTLGGTTTDDGYTTTEGRTSCLSPQGTGEESLETMDPASPRVLMSVSSLPLSPNEDNENNSDVILLRSASSCTTECASPNRGGGGGNLSPDFNTDDHRQLPTLSPPAVPHLRSSMTTPRVGHLSRSNKPDLASTMSSPVHHHNNNKDRVPGGAAAKLMLVGPQGSDEDGRGVVAPTTREEAILEPVHSVGESNHQTSVGEDAVNASLEQDLQNAKEEFAKGTPRRRRATKIGETADQPAPPPMTTTPLNPSDTSLALSTSSLPSLASPATNDSHPPPNTNGVVTAAPRFLDPQEIFHASAEAAIAALLTSPMMTATMTTTATTTTSHTRNSNDIFFSHSQSPRQSPSNLDHSHDETAAANAAANSSTSLHPSSLLSETTLRHVGQLAERMLTPSKTLTDLLTAIASPDAVVDVGAAVRRKNACGALQTLTTNPTQRVQLAWTAGVVPALTRVLWDQPPSNTTLLPVRTGSTTEASTKSQPAPTDAARIRSEYLAARNRAISALMNLSMVVKNRLPLMHSPGLVHACVWTIQQQQQQQQHDPQQQQDNDDYGRARRGCCAILGFLAKSRENRRLLAQVPELGTMVSNVLRPRVVPDVTVTVQADPSSRHKKNGSPSKNKKNEEENSSVDSNSSRHNNNNTTSNNSNKMERQQQQQQQDDESFSSEGSSVSGSFKNQVGKNSNKLSAAAAGSTEVHVSSGYDDTADEFLQGARQNLFAMMGHLVKEKDNAYFFARDLNLVSTLVDITRYQESPSHALAIQILAHLTRHRLNKSLAFKPKTFVPALVEATQSPSDEARLYACYALQNLSQEKSCRQELAIAAHLIEVLCDRCRNGTQDAERLAAVSTLKNLCDEPANLIPMTNTTGCVSTLMHFAHNGGWNGNTVGGGGGENKEEPDDGNDDSGRHVTAVMQYRACDALATLSHWLRKIATSGNSLDRNQQGRPPTKGLFVPSLREVSWNQWT